MPSDRLHRINVAVRQFDIRIESNGEILHFDRFVPMCRRFITVDVGFRRGERLLHGVVRFVYDRLVIRRRHAGKQKDEGEEQKKYPFHWAPPCESVSVSVMIVNSVNGILASCEYAWMDSM